MSGVRHGLTVTSYFTVRKRVTYSLPTSDSMLSPEVIGVPSLNPF